MVIIYNTTLDLIGGSTQKGRPAVSDLAHLILLQHCSILSVWSIQLKNSISCQYAEAEMNADHRRRRAVISKFYGAQPLLWEGHPLH